MPTFHTLLFRRVFVVVIRLFIVRSRFRLGFFPEVVRYKYTRSSVLPHDPSGINQARLGPSVPERHLSPTCDRAVQVPSFWSAPFTIRSLYSLTPLVPSRSACGIFNLRPVSTPSVGWVAVYDIGVTCRNRRHPRARHPLPSPFAPGLYLLASPV
jgi:hypothetical protein